MKHYGLIGGRLGHSLSVPIHRAIFDAMGIDADYRLIELPAEGFRQAAARLMDELDGFNVTIPYKQTILPLLSGLDGAAQEIGAVNTVDAATRLGYNTDAPGFAAMLRHHGIDPAGQPCFVLGTGGASLAVRAALRGMGAEAVTMVSRHPAEGELGYDQLSEHFRGVLVNTTPVGMWPAVDGCPLTEDQLAVMLPRACGVADVIYNPADTVLTRAARACGVPACTGLYMLVAQAVEAERIWQRTDLPDHLTDRIMKELVL